MVTRFGRAFDPDPPLYEPLSKIGWGAFAEVWKVRAAATGIEKALKVLHSPDTSEFTRRERRALELLKNLRHPFVLVPEDYWFRDERLHIVMELAEGSFRGLLQEHQALGDRGVPIDRLLGLLAEIAAGIDFLHANDIVHRDIKPENLLTVSGHGKVADCGVARARLMHPLMSIAGTPRYMAPEVWGNGGGFESDRYSFALTYAELRQGRHPLKGTGFCEWLRAQEHEEFDFDELIGTDEETVLRRALAKSPDRRFATCGELVSALTRATTAF
jgi:serine/threonine protein kinase